MHYPWGSSPLSRGIPAGSPYKYVEDGIIPALAGNTDHESVSVVDQGDHPRSRGEYVGVGGFPHPHSGSSPLSRGIPYSIYESIGIAGIIPALAGNTGSSGHAWAVTADHPRSRGEYRVPDHDGDPAAGSSPLSRGIRSRAAAVSRSLGIIPALAGNTCFPVATSVMVADHPRSRGEYPIEEAKIHSFCGSSPLSRGIRPVPWAKAPSHRIIPALAGNTPARRSPACRERDHPRSRGEYGPHRIGNLSVTGSSPLSRGIRRRPSRRYVCTGIIPALAGNTYTIATPILPTRDHPRSRGEYAGQPDSKPHLLGSSPLSRGIPKVSPRQHHPAGIIPALAGNTCW